MYFGFIANYYVHKQCASNVQRVTQIFDVRETLRLDDISKLSVQLIKAFAVAYLTFRADLIKQTGLIKSQQSTISSKMRPTMLKL